MEKYSKEFKLKVINYYLKKNEGYVKVAEHFKVSDSTVLQWVRKYKENGEEGLVTKTKKNYDGDFKKEVVEYMHENHLSYLETAKHFNLGSTNVPSAWDKIYKKKGAEALYHRKPYKMKKRRSRKAKKVKAQVKKTVKVSKAKISKTKTSKTNASKTKKAK